MRSYRRATRCLSIAAVLLAGALVVGCATHGAPLISRADLSEAQLFPFYKLYWAGVEFDHQPVTATDGIKGYSPTIGDGIDYGSCDKAKGALNTGGCALPLEIVTVIWKPHCNAPLGTQHNVIIRGVPATVFDGGRSIELYTGHEAIDVYADSPSRARRAADVLRPINAPGRAGAPLPPPTYRPGLWGPAPRYRVAAGLRRQESAGIIPQLAICPKVAARR